MMALHPGHFPVGSAMGRAAARQLIEERRAKAKLVDLVLECDANHAPTFGPWQDNGNGSYTRRSHVPAGMKFEDAERAAGLAPVAPQGEYLRLTIDL